MAEKFFFQKITVDETGVELALQWIKNGCFVETLDLSSPRLILTFRDDLSYFRRDVKTGYTLKVIFADRWHTDGINLTLSFTVMDVLSGMAKNEGYPVTRIECLQKEIAEAKRIETAPIFFSEKPVPAIIKRLLPGFRKYEIDPFPVSTFHLFPGRRRTRLARLMCGELAAFIYAVRGDLYVKQMSSVSGQSPAIKMEYGRADVSEEMKIMDCRRLDDTVLPEMMERNYQGWDITKGRRGGGTGGAGYPYGSPHVRVLKNMATRFLPLIDFTLRGDGNIMPGKKASIRWHTVAEERGEGSRPIDDSLPAEIIISEVVHAYSAQRYMCRVTGGVVL